MYEHITVRWGIPTYTHRHPLYNHIGIWIPVANNAPFTCRYNIGLVFSFLHPIQVD